jgi:hypothetical protein
MDASTAGDPSASEDLRARQSATGNDAIIAPEGRDRGRFIKGHSTSVQGERCRARPGGLAEHRRVDHFRTRTLVHPTLPHLRRPVPPAISVPHQPDRREALLAEEPDHGQSNHPGQQ